MQKTLILLKIYLQLYLKKNSPQILLKSSFHYYFQKNWNPSKTWKYLKLDNLGKKNW